MISVTRVLPPGVRYSRCSPGTAPVSARPNGDFGEQTSRPSDVAAPSRSAMRRPARGLSPTASGRHGTGPPWSRIGGPWPSAVERLYPGSYGIPPSYEEAREALTMATRRSYAYPLR